MPDSFFTSSKPRKRKRTESSSAHAEAALPGKSKKFIRKSVSSQEGSRKKKVNGVVHKRKPRVDEDLSDQTDGGDGSGIDDMDLRANMDEDPGASGEEDENETPAEKRLRLAQLYLDSVKVDLGEHSNTFVFFETVVHALFYFQRTENTMRLISTGNSSPLDLSKMYWTILANFIFLSQIP